MKRISPGDTLPESGAPANCHDTPVGLAGVGLARVGLAREAFSVEQLRDPSASEEDLEHE